MMSTQVPSRFQRSKRAPAMTLDERLMGMSAAGALASVTCETLLVDPLLFGLTTASPLQRAVCRVVEGVPLGDLADDTTVQESFNCTAEVLRKMPRPAEFAGLAGIRTYKSGLAAVFATHAALRCNAEGLRPGEQLRVPIVSTKLENAKAVYQHLSNAWKLSPLLRPMLMTDPDTSADRFMVRRPDGVMVEFLTVAGSRAGSALVSFWLAAVVFDEYARMTGDESEGVINWSEQRAAILHRVRKGGYILHISSPYGEFGPAWEHVTENLGKPTPQLVVMRARADHMNPIIWTKEACDEAREKDLESYLTDVCAQFISGESQFFHKELIEKALRKGPEVLPPDPKCSYVAAMDPATRGNAWTLAIATRIKEKRVVVWAKEWRGTSAIPLDPDAILLEVKPILEAYRIDSVASDQWSGDTLVALARHHQLRITPYNLTEREKWQRYLSLRTEFELHRIEIPNLLMLRKDLSLLRKSIKSGASQVVAPHTTDGRHADFGPMLMLLLTRTIDDVKPEEPTEAQKEEQRAIEASLRMYREENGLDDE